MSFTAAEPEAAGVSPIGVPDVEAFFEGVAARIAGATAGEGTRTGRASRAELEDELRVWGYTCTAAGTRGGVAGEEEGLDEGSVLGGRKEMRTGRKNKIAWHAAAKLRLARISGDTHAVPSRPMFYSPYNSRPSSPASSPARSSSSRTSNSTSS